MQSRHWKIAGIAAFMVFIFVVGALTYLSLRRSASFHFQNGTYAVFLANGQVYFGSIERENQDEIALQNIYYIQLKNASGTVATDQPDASLLKLGNELHGPEDWMLINRRQILFIEKLREDSRVLKAMREYKTP